MNSDRQTSLGLRNAVCGVISAVLVAGCAQSGNLARTSVPASQAGSSKAMGALDRAIAQAERTVTLSPQDAAARLALGHAYLGAGRFESAATTFGDAIQLGDTSPRTALSLALAKVGTGHNGEAVTILDQQRDSLPASDYGLALALAGETSRGVAILGDALRAGDDTPKLRQNLAYAYALDGRWREARIMAAQDLPADQLDMRISDWAMQGKPEDFQKRVASLLGAPVREDSGQPQHLALNGNPMSATPVETAETAAPEAPQMAAAELPPVDTNGEFAVSEAVPVEAPADVAVASAPLEPAPVPVAAVTPAAPSAGSFDSAFGSGSAAASLVFVSNPVIQPIADYAVSQTAAQPRAPANGSHLVQLGSFTSEAGARRAWSIYVARNPELKLHDMVISTAVVRGRSYWRVAAAGFDQSGASGLCSSIRNRGGGCIAYAASRPLPGSVPMHGKGGPMMARR